MLSTHQAVAFPHIYRPAGGWRALLLVLSMLLGGPAALGVWYFGTGHETRGAHDAAVLVIGCLAFFLLSAYLVAWIFLARVTLWPDRIESRGLFTTHTLARDEVLGRRLLKPRDGPPYIVLVPRHHGRKQIKVGTIFNFDAEFHEWIASLPDLDARDRQAAELEIANNQEIGATPDDRTEALRRGKRLSTILTIATVMIAVWAGIYPYPYRLVICVLMLLPWVALAVVVRAGGLFRIDAKKNSPHPNVALPFIMPGFLLMLRVVTDVNLLQWMTPLYLSIALTCVLGTAALLADRSLSRSRGTAILLFVLSMAYGFGASMQANALLDHSPGSSYRAEVTGKYISGGRHTTYELYLAPWGPKREQDKVSVSRWFYDSVEPGDAVCVVLRDGALHVPWYTVGHCPNNE
jgi:hypothetical protein